MATLTAMIAIIGEVRLAAVGRVEVAITPARLALDRARAVA